MTEMVRARYGPGAKLGTDVRLTYPLDTLLDIPHQTIWSGHPGAVIRDSIEELIVALERLPHQEIFNSHYGPVDPGSYNMASYLRCTRVRILHLYQALQRMGFRKNGSILEVGSLYGCFALVLQRLGFQVTAVDRYDSYGPGFRRAIELMQAAGVQVVSATRGRKRGPVVG